MNKLKIVFYFDTVHFKYKRRLNKMKCSNRSCITLVKQQTMRFIFKCIRFLWDCCVKIDQKEKSNKVSSMSLKQTYRLKRWVIRYFLLCYWCTCQNWTSMYPLWNMDSTISKPFFDFISLCCISKAKKKKKPTNYCFKHEWILRLNNSKYSY